MNLDPLLWVVSVEAEGVIWPFDWTEGSEATKDDEVEDAHKTYLSRFFLGLNV